MARNGKISRLDQIVAWCAGKDIVRRKMSYVDQKGITREKEVLFAPKFDGVIVFDECHKAKNYGTAKEGEDRVPENGSQTARCSLQFSSCLLIT